MRIGVISDTHNYFDPQIPKLLAGVEHILHAGDIGLPSILVELQEIAPVTAVWGNTDDPGFHYQLTQTVELASRRFFLHHIVNPHAPDDWLQEELAGRATRFRGGGYAAASRAFLKSAPQINP